MKRIFAYGEQLHEEMAKAEAFTSIANSEGEEDGGSSEEANDTSLAPTV